MYYIKTCSCKNSRTFYNMLGSSTLYIKTCIEIQVRYSENEEIRVLQWSNSLFVLVLEEKGGG